VNIGRSIIMKFTAAFLLLASGASAFQSPATKSSRAAPLNSYLSSLSEMSPLASTPGPDMAARGGDVSISKNDFFARRADEDRAVSLAPLSQTLCSYFMYHHQTSSTHIPPPAVCFF
jgi:hypothetical protein